LGEEFKRAIVNDLNTPEALAALWATVKDESITQGEKKSLLLDFDKVLGLNIENNEYEVAEIPEQVESLLTERAEARKSENWQKSDDLREKIKGLGYEVRDEDGAQNLKKI
jgi:cysteinyl-tRNA synthetase